MKEGDKVRLRGNPRPLKAGIVRRVSSRNVEVTWRMGSGWNHTIEHDISELENI
jgi:hypothetical protein